MAIHSTCTIAVRSSYFKREFFPSQLIAQHAIVEAPRESIIRILNGGDELPPPRIEHVGDKWELIVSAHKYPHIQGDWSISQNGEYVAFIARESASLQIWEWGLNTRDLLHTKELKSATLTSIYFSSNHQLVEWSRSVVGNGLTTYIRTWNPATGQPQPLVTLRYPGFDLAVPVVSPDGQRVLEISHSGAIHMWAKGPRGMMLSSIPEADAIAVRYSPDGSTFVSTTRVRLSVELWHSQTGALLWVFYPDMVLNYMTPDLDHSMGLAYSKEGEVLATARSFHAEVWDLNNRSLTVVLVPRMDTYYEPWVVWLNDGRSLALREIDRDGGRRYVSWNLITRTVSRSPILKDVGDPEIELTRPSRDGLVLASRQKGSAVRVWDPILFQDLFKQSQVKQSYDESGTLILSDVGKVTLPDPRFWPASPEVNRRNPLKTHTQFRF